MALTFTFTETVLAATCAPGMDMAHMEMAGMEAPATGGLAGPESPGEAEDRQCPFGPASAVQGCTGVASLPSHTAHAFSPGTELTSSLFGELLQQDLLLVTALFHPPRA